MRCSHHPVRSYVLTRMHACVAQGQVMTWSADLVAQASLSLGPRAPDLLQSAVYIYTHRFTYLRIFALQSVSVATLAHCDTVFPSFIWDIGKAPDTTSSIASRRRQPSRISAMHRAHIVRNTYLDWHMVRYAFACRQSFVKLSLRSTGIYLRILSNIGIFIAA